VVGHVAVDYQVLDVAVLGPELERDVPDTAKSEKRKKENRPKRIDIKISSTSNFFN
jgi:hypothetical protein